MFIDIHNHTLFGVDDGAETMEDSLAILKDMKRQGACGVIFTPHYRHGMFNYPLERIQTHFEELKDVAKDLELELHLGCEYHVNRDIIDAFQSERCLPLAGSDYVLTEYSQVSEYSFMVEQTHRLLSCGYFPVIAHVERYACLLKKPALCAELANMGALIQINADSVLGLDGRAAEKFCKKLLKHEWADIIASDTHDMDERACHMAECKMHVEKKYGAEYAHTLFVTNPKRIINNR